jgi:DnaJ-class molecular chaperone
MAKSKTRRHAFICDTCRGNGYIKLIHDNDETTVHQCWTCESQGEFYVDESEIVESYINANGPAIRHKSKLH